MLAALVNSDKKTFFKASLERCPLFKYLFWIFFRNLIMVVR